MLVTAPMLVVVVVVVVCHHQHHRSSKLHSFPHQGPRGNGVINGLTNTTIDTTTTTTSTTNSSGTTTTNVNMKDSLAKIKARRRVVLGSALVDGSSRYSNNSCNTNYGGDIR